MHIKERFRDQLWDTIDGYSEEKVDAAMKRVEGADEDILLAYALYCRFSSEELLAIARLRIGAESYSPQEQLGVLAARIRAENF